MVREKRKMISGVLSIGNEDIIMNSWFSIYVINTYGNMNMDAHVYTHTHTTFIYFLALRGPGCLAQDADF